MRNAFSPTQTLFDGLTFPARIHFSKVIGWMPTFRATSAVEGRITGSYTSLFLGGACQALAKGSTRVVPEHFAGGELHLTRLNTGWEAGLRRLIRLNDS